MRIYDGSPRQDFEEVFRSIGAFLDSRGMRDILLVEVPEGFVLQGLVASGADAGSWSESIGQITKETLSFYDDDIAKFMEEASARRGGGQPGAAVAGTYERSLRVIGRWIDVQKPKDVFLFEQDGAYVVRLLEGGQAGAKHSLSEFTREDIAVLIDQGPDLRNKPQPTSPPLAVAQTPLSAGAGTHGESGDTAAAAPAEPAASQQPASGGWNDTPL